MKAMRRTLTAAVSLLAAGFAPGASGWGPQGHRTVGAIADRLLSPAAQAGVAQLLEHDRDKFGNPSGRRTLEAVSVWADEIRGTSASRPLWHYDNVPLCGRAPKASYCPDGQCNSEQIKRLAGVLGDPGTSLPERNEALKWLVHLVGDLHQPLHAADNDDAGGNRVEVALAGVRTRGRESLHRLWDNDLVRLALGVRSRQQPPRDIAALAGEARELLARLGEGSPDGWALESHHLAREVAYAYPGFVCGRIPPAMVVLDATYQQRAEAVVRERLLLAGARLAGLLNRTLAAATAARERRLP
jgi:S1/P1 Nuclease